MELISKKHVLELLEYEWAKYHGECSASTLYTNIYNGIKGLKPEKLKTEDNRVTDKDFIISDEDAEKLRNALHGVTEWLLNGN